MDKLLMLNILLSQFNYEYNSEYENLSDEEKVYMDYVDMCLNDPNEKICDACSKAMLLILKIISKIDIEEELSNEEIALEKEQLLSEFNQEDKERIESFMYACIQTVGIYSEERVQERRQEKDKKYNLYKRDQITKSSLFFNFTFYKSLLELLLFGGLFAFVPNDRVDYKEILKYENVLQLKLPKTGILVYKQSSDINSSINDLTDMTAYYNKKISIKNLDKQIKNSKVWINKKDLDNDLNKQFPLVVKMNDFDNLYISFYNTDTKQYNTKIETPVKQHVILTVYCKRTRSISFYEYTYDNHSK